MAGDHGEVAGLEERVMMQPIVVKRACVACDDPTRGRCAGCAEPVCADCASGHDCESNTNCLEGLRCPSCGTREPLHIEVRTVVRMFDDGSDACSGEQDWDDTSYCACVGCHFDGMVADFRRLSTPHTEGFTAQERFYLALIAEREELKAKHRELWAQKDVVLGRSVVEQWPWAEALGQVLHRLTQVEAHLARGGR